MFRNFLKVTLQSYLHSKLYSFINMFGLAVGLASVILIGLYVVDELSYDRQWADSDRLYRISRDFYPADDVQATYLATNAPPVALLLKADFTEVEETARLFRNRGLLSRRETDARFFEDEMRFVDASFFELFDLVWLQGDPATALESPTAIVLTESAKRRYFGEDQALGQTLWLENLVPMPVTGVIADFSQNTHLSGNVFGNLDGMFGGVFGEEARGDWQFNGFHTYARVAPGTDMEALSAQFPAFLDRHLAENASERSGLAATPITDIHLYSDRQQELSAQGNLSTVITLISIALGILFIACFNFMNLSTARSELRSKEVGIRKAIGSQRGHLILQFLGESLIMTLLATVLAVVMVEVALPAFNGFTGKDLALHISSDGRILLLLASLVVVVGGIAGSYPAFYLSSFKPAQVLRSKARASMADLMFRNLLVIFQFSISIILVVATAVVFMQTRFARDYDIGFNKDQVVILQGSPSQGLGPNWETLKQELLDNPDILSVTSSGIAPGTQNFNTFSARAEGMPEPRELTAMLVDYDFFETYAIEVLAGRTYSKDFPNDVFNRPGENPGGRTSGFVLNAAAARELGWTPESAIGRELDIITSGDGDYSPGRVVGVVANSNFESVRFSIKPTIFALVSDRSLAGSASLVGNLPNLYFGSVHVSGRNLSETLAYIDEVWNEVIPDFPIARSFLNERFDALYQDDTRLGQMFSSFASLAILIACLGLFGLASFNTQRRTKEIGIRKVMGGSVWSIVLLLTNDFSKLVLLSNLIAWPVAYIAMNRWLENFAYRIDLTPLVFIGSGLVALCIAWVTVGGTAAKAASQKPVLALRYE
jgi:putative ABC transport system permease protein